ncbi:MAG TPA: hypothetical protein VGE41_09670, partial [Verrucomicrobiae bacterium]
MPKPTLKQITALTLLMSPLVVAMAVLVSHLPVFVPAPGAMTVKTFSDAGQMNGSRVSIIKILVSTPSPMKLLPNLAAPTFSDAHGN